MGYVKTKLGEGGRVVIPVDQRKALGLKSGDTVLLRVDGTELRMVSLKESIRRAQALVARHVKGKGKRLLSEELIAERRKEAARE